MDYEKYESWLKSLNVGDELAIEIFHLSRPNTYKLSRVEKITPSRIVKVEGDTGQYRNGRNKSSGNKLIPFTNDVLDAMDKEVLLYKLNTLKFSELPCEKLRRIIEIVEE